MNHIWIYIIGPFAYAGLAALLFQLHAPGGKMLG